MQKHASLDKKVTEFASAFTTQDIEKWTLNVTKTLSIEAEVSSIKLKLTDTNTEHLRQEIRNLNVLILTLATKDEHDRLQQDVNRLKPQLVDLDYTLNAVQTTMQELNMKIDKNADASQIEFSKIHDRLEKFEAGLVAVKANAQKV